MTQIYQLLKQQKVINHWFRIGW